MVRVSSFSIFVLLVWMRLSLLISKVSLRRVSSPKVYLGLVLTALYNAKSDGVSLCNTGALSNSSILTSARAIAGVAALIAA